MPRPANPPTLEQENAALRCELAALRRFMESELEQMVRIQQALMPPDEIAIPGLRAAHCYRSFEQASGDYYDIVRLNPRDDTAEDPARPRWGAIIADASGHGPAAAMEAVMLDAILRTYPDLASGPAQVVRYVNRHFFTRRIRGTLMTALLVSYHPTERRLDYVCAGHPPALLRRAGGGPIERLDRSGGIPLGVERTFDWQEASVAMGPGDLLLLYTDGAFEARSPAGERFGLGRLEQTLADAPAEPRQVLETVRRLLIDFRGHDRTQDDVALVALEVTA